MLNRYTYYIERCQGFLKMSTIISGSFQLTINSAIESIIFLDLFSLLQYLTQLYKDHEFKPQRHRFVLKLLSFFKTKSFKAWDTGTIYASLELRASSAYLHSGHGRLFCHKIYQQIPKLFVGARSICGELIYLNIAAQEIYGSGITGSSQSLRPKLKIILRYLCHSIAWD